MLIPVSVHKFTHVLVSPSLTDPPDVVIQMNMPRYAWSDFESDDELMYLIFTQQLGTGTEACEHLPKLSSSNPPTLGPGARRGLESARVG